MDIQIDTIGDLRKLIANLPDDTKVCFERGRKGYGVDYVWHVYVAVGELRNHNEGCGACDEALRSPRSLNIADCNDHSGTHLLIKV